MPPPPLPSRDDDEHGAMPADCRVETIAMWLQREGGITYVESARAVRALVEAKVREAIDRARVGTGAPATTSSIVPLPVESIVSRVLGAP